MPQRRWRPLALVVAALLLVVLGAGMSAIFMSNRGRGKGDGPLAQGGDSKGDERPGPDGKKEGAKSDKEKKSVKDTPGPDDDPNVLTVAKNGKAKYRTIGDALEKVKPGQTIRVVDDSVYREPLVLNRNEQFAGVRLEATAGATLTAPERSVSLTLRGVQGVSVRGFRLQAPDNAPCNLVGLVGECGAVVLEELQFDGTGSKDSIGVIVVGPTALTASAAPVLTARNCTFHRLDAGVWLLGAPRPRKVTGGHPGPRHPPDRERLLRLQIWSQTTRPTRAGADRR